MKQSLVLSTFAEIYQGKMASAINLVAGEIGIPRLLLSFTSMLLLVTTRLVHGTRTTYSRIQDNGTLSGSILFWSPLATKLSSKLPVSR